MTETSPGDLGGSKEALWKRLLPIVLSLALVVFIFGWLLPQYIDYDAVFRAIGKVRFGEWMLLVLFAAIRLIPEAWIYQAALPGIGFRRGLTTFLVTASLNNIPPGGLDLVARYQMARSWGVSPTGASTATVATWFYVSFPRLMLPVIAVGLLTLDYIRDETMDQLALIGILVTVVLTVLVVLAVRSERFISWAGGSISKLADFALGLFRKQSEINFDEMAIRFRDEGLELVRRRWGYGFPAGILAQFAQFAILLLAVRAVDLEVGWIAVFAAFAAVAIIQAIPIFNIPGIAEAVLIIAIGATVEGGNDQIAAAVFVFRILTWLVPIPLGGVAFSRWRTWAKTQPAEQGLTPSDG